MRACLEAFHKRTNSHVRQKCHIDHGDSHHVFATVYAHREVSTCQCVQSFSSPPATILTFSSLRRSPTTTSRCARSAQSGISSEGARPPQSRDPRNKYIDLRRCRYLPQRQTPSRHGPSLNKPMNIRRHAQQGYPYPHHKLPQGLHRPRKPLS